METQVAKIFDEEKNDAVVKAVEKTEIETKRKTMYELVMEGCISFDYAAISCGLLEEEFVRWIIDNGLPLPDANTL